MERHRAMFERRAGRVFFAIVTTYRASMNILPCVSHNKIKSIKYKVLKPKACLSEPQLHRRDNTKYVGFQK